MISNQTRFRELVDRIVDGSCSDAERREFEKIVENDQSLAGEIVEQIRTHSLLQWQAQDLSSLASTSAKQIEFPEKGLSDRSRFRLNGKVMMAAAIALIACTTWAWFEFGRRLDKSASLSAVAEISREDVVDWAEGSTALKNHQQIVPGRLEIKSGTLTLRFRSGATLTVYGPVAMQVESDMLVRLEKGRASAHVPQWARGFTVQTPDAKVVDLGTRFGVDARTNGLTDVVVFEGEVDVTPAIGTATVPTRLTQGEAARVDRQGAIGRIVEVRRDQWGGQWSTESPLPGHSVFKAIRDNIKPADSAKFYQITPHGLVEDAPAYVDRRHQWNGVTAEGLPDFLRGADYVRTFNDYKYHAELEIELELSEPADVYIFSDDRVVTPKWLTTQFENTGFKIGLDEGPWPEINPNDPNLSTDIGAGNSIDNVFTVWRRRCERPETLILGAIGEPVEACAIYGIAAKPLE